MNRDLNNRYSNGKVFKDLDPEQKILSRSSGFRVPEGISGEEALAHLKSRIAERESRLNYFSSGAIRRFPLLISAIAAISLLLFGLWFLLLRSYDKKVIADKGTHIDYRLPDGSQVTINADSRIDFRRRNFMEDRKIKLDGEAFFDVTKGSTFQISTKLAQIQVLGTSFNVYSRDNLFKISCITGKIKVSAENSVVEITPGESATVTGDTLLRYTDKNLNASTGWVKGEFYFENSPINLVLEEIERQFNVNFVAIDLSGKYFTGSFTNNNLKNSLDIVCIPMGLTFEIGNHGKVFIRKKTN